MGVIKPTAASDEARFAQASQAIRAMSDELKAELDDAARPAFRSAVMHWLRDVTREAPLQALGVAFLLGVMLARR
jgi:hypothetical protein